MSVSSMQACWSTRVGRSTYALECYLRIDMCRETSRIEVEWMDYAHARDYAEVMVATKEQGEKEHSYKRK
jgi:hypothetical protein